MRKAPTDKKPFKGLVLKVTPYGEGDNVAQLFGGEQGLVSCFVTRAELRRGGLSQLSPLTELEALLWRGTGQLWRLSDVTVESFFAGLRLQGDRLQAAGTMARWLLVTQQEGRAAPLLYRLTVTLLGLLQEGLAPSTVLAAFAVKLLMHEGLFNERLCCEVCGSGVFPQQISEGGSLCPDHSAAAAMTVTALLWSRLAALAAARSGAALAALDVDDATLELALALLRMRLGEGCGPPPS